ncbi:MAG: LPS export ABC transporter periplasmic protein LptC [Alphaproteobacteria bacterium]|nr:LPS export ABC transporter periplasmic protein LptC [Alphaproteobacteria bacterium]
MARPCLTPAAAGAAGTIVGGRAGPRGERSFVRSQKGARVSAAAVERYSRFVDLLKVLLPAFAVALVAVVALFAVGHRPENVLTVQFEKMVERLEDDLTMFGPRFRGVDSANRPFLVSAARARQEPGKTDAAYLEDVSAEMLFADRPDLGRVRLTAREGVIESATSRLELTGGVRLATGAGDSFATEAFSVDLKARQGESLGPVAGEGPLGRVRADRLVIAEAGRVMRFEGHVRTVIHRAEGAAGMRPAAGVP